MARKKESENIITNYAPADVKLTEKLGEAFERIVTAQYGNFRAPTPYITPFGIKHLDALLGGGFISSAPIILSSTPESGKSTVAYQFSSIFQTVYPNSIVVYLDIEAAGNTSDDSLGISRIQNFNIDTKRFRYEPIIVDVVELFKIIESLGEMKTKFEQQIQREFLVLIIWDSIAATPSSKVADADDVNSTIGVKARQLTFCLEKYAGLLAHKRITFLAIDQVRANIQMPGTQYVAKEKSVGIFNDFKAASSIAALNHKVTQWLYLARKTAITPEAGLGINGWILNIKTEKCKSVPSQETISCVFDKNHGLDKFWSEFLFLSEMTPSEKKYYKDTSKLIFPLSIVSSGAYNTLFFDDPTTGSRQYESPKFYKRKAKELYTSNEEFKQAFDYIVEMAVKFRIQDGLFKNNQLSLVINDEIDEDDNSDSELLQIVENDTNQDELENVNIDDELKEVAF